MQFRLKPFQLFSQRVLRYPDSRSYSPQRRDGAQSERISTFPPVISTVTAHVVAISLCLSSQPEGATPEEEAVHLSEEGIPGSGSGSRVVGINPRVNGRGSVRPLHPREQNYYQGMTPFTVKHSAASLILWRYL